MPIYEYECRACGHGFEEIQKISDPPRRRCPECGKPKAERLISRTSFQLKGDGWFSSGYSKKPKQEKKAADVDSGAEA